jgi:hypothetical protein
VEDVAVPIGPHVDWRSGRVEPHPDDFLIRGLGEGNPGSVSVVPPEKVISNDPPGRVDHGGHPNERERFICLEV